MYPLESELNPGSLSRINFTQHITDYPLNLRLSYLQHEITCYGFPHDSSGWPQVYLVTRTIGPSCPTSVELSSEGHSCPFLVGNPYREVYRVNNDIYISKNNSIAGGG